MQLKQPEVTENLLIHARRQAMSRSSFIIGLVLWTLVLGALYLVTVRKLSRDAPVAGASAQQVDEPSSELSETEPIEATQKTVTISFPSQELPEFEFPECMGGTVSRDSLKGHRWLANFIFTRCAGPCPLMTRDISELQRQAAKSNADFRFVTFSVDPAYDTVEVLRKYAETFQADHARWKFVTGNEEAIHDLIRRGFTQYVQPNLGDLRKPGFEVAHSNRAVLVNENGIPVGSFVMTIPGDVAKLRRIIEGKDDFPEPGPGISFSAATGENPSVPLTLVPAEDAHGDSDETEETKTPSTDKMPDSETADPTTSETPQARNRKIDERLPAWAARMPSINAGLNSASILLLLSGLAAIKAGRKIRHRNLMIAAFLVSVAFLICYLTYHEVLYRFTEYRGRGFEGGVVATRVYFSILIPHVILAAVVPVLALRVFYLAFRERWSEHRRLAKMTLPIWLFVSITGVIIYGMLYHWPWTTETVAMSVAQ
ncbi:MAG: DUF420 domain-containing protein [Planctomycetaceae bacterium]|nr:DUF420 domain-containing protein [Planctomycetaceae bacterium]